MSRKYALLLLPLLLALLLKGLAGLDFPTGTNDGDGQSDTTHIVQAFVDQAHDLPVSGSGTVVKVLADDDRGSRHQRLIVRLAPGHTVLIAHNIDLAPRISDPKVGDRLEFKGIYEYNPQGGVIHWTHHDPNGRHPGGWLRHRGNLYR